ncbi:MAG: DUF3667 domain-containing protein [Erythrobacter sp.]
MSDVAEGFGAAIEGALAANAVEPTDGDAAKRQGAEDDAHPGDCANCGATVSGSYCSSCGQKVHIHRTLSAIGHDLLHGVLHLDGKIWKTLPLLALKPGELTSRYIEGERATFVSPMAMFLFSVFAMFAVFQMAGISTPTDLGPMIDEEQAQAISEESAKLERDRADLEADLANAQTAEEKSAIANRLEEVKGNLTAYSIASRLAEGEEPEIADGVETVEPEGPPVKVSGDIGLPFLKKLAAKWQQNPGLMLYKMQANAYKFSWLLIPLSLPFVWLLFAWKRRFRAYDHAVFVTYSLSFMSLLFIVISLVAVSSLDGFGGWAFTIFATIAPLHIYKHLRHSYGLSRLSTIWRFALLTVFIVIVIALFLQALLLLGAF